MGEIIAICTSQKKGTRKTEVNKIELLEDFGLKDDAHGGKWIRQVSFLAKEEIDNFNAKGGDVVYGDFGENIVTSGIDFQALKIGDQLSSGNSVLELTKFGKECHDRCEIFYRVGDCIMPKFGVFAKVISGGEIKAGDTINLV